MQSRHEVVVVDGLPETEEVLRAVLEPRGMDVVRVQSSAGSSGSSSDEARVLVVHGDDTGGEPPVAAGRTDVPRIFIGRIALPSTVTGAVCRCLPQPFHYADLIAAIEELAAPSAS